MWNECGNSLITYVIYVCIVGNWVMKSNMKPPIIESMVLMERCKQFWLYDGSEKSFELRYFIEMVVVVNSL